VAGSCLRGRGAESLSFDAAEDLAIILERVDGRAIQFGGLVKYSSTHPSRVLECRRYHDTDPAEVEWRQRRRLAAAVSDTFLPRLLLAAP